MIFTIIIINSIANLLLWGVLSYIKHPSWVEIVSNNRTLGYYVLLTLIVPPYITYITVKQLVEYFVCLREDKMVSSLTGSDDMDDIKKEENIYNKLNKHKHSKDDENRVDSLLEEL